MDRSPELPSPTRVPASGSGVLVIATARSAPRASLTPYALPTGAALYGGIAARSLATRPAAHSTQAAARPTAETAQPTQPSSTPPTATSMGLLLIVAGGAVSYRQLRPRAGGAPAAGGDEAAED